MSKRKGGVGQKTTFAKKSRKRLEKKKKMLAIKKLKPAERKKALAELEGK